MPTASVRIFFMNGPRRFDPDKTTTIGNESKRN